VNGWDVRDLIQVAQLVMLLPLWRLAGWLMRLESRVQSLEHRSHTHQREMT
jgi:hypothetical protein